MQVRQLFWHAVYWFFVLLAIKQKMNARNLHLVLPYNRNKKYPMANAFYCTPQTPRVRMSLARNAEYSIQETTNKSFTCLISLSLSLSFSQWFCEMAPGSNRVHSLFTRQLVHELLIRVWVCPFSSETTLQGKKLDRENRVRWWCENREL